MTIPAAVEASPVAARRTSPPVFPTVVENHPRRWLVYPLLAIFIGLFAIALAGFYEPTNLGVDQNGYNVTARLLLQHHRLYFIPHNPWQFAGMMMIQTSNGRIFAKYPPGMGVLGVLAWLFAGPHGMYLVDPFCVVLACLASFFLFRQVLGNFMALMGVIWLACNPVTLSFADDSNSHGAALFFTVLGFWALLSWWKRGQHTASHDPRPVMTDEATQIRSLSWSGAWRATLAGLALGFCTWIRYTEFLWIAPLLAVLVMPSWRQRPPLRECLLALAAFSLPLVILALIQWVSFGAPWITGYAFCREQTGFGWQYFVGDPIGRQGNWQTVLEQFTNLGLFLLFPLALVGLVRMFFSHWKLALVLALWAVPSSFVYMFYYWAPSNVQTTGYLRFFLDVFPALILVALWLLDQAMGRDRIVTAVSVGSLTLLGAGYSLYTIAPNLLAQFNSKLALKTAVDTLRHYVPHGSVVFADETTCDYLDSIGGYRLYSINLFLPQAFFRYQQIATDHGPQGLQEARGRLYRRLLGQTNAAGKWQPKPRPQIQRAELALIQTALRQHKRVVFLVHTNELRQVVPPAAQLRTKVLNTFYQPVIRPGFNALWAAWFQPNPAAWRHWQQMQWRWKQQNQWTLLEILRQTRTRHGEKK